MGPKQAWKPQWQFALGAFLGAFFGAILAMLVAIAPARAQDETSPPRQSDVAVALVLAVDTSGSVSNGRFELQKQGYAAAFRDPQVLNAIRSLATQSIAVTMVQWTGPQRHAQVVGWTVIRDEVSAGTFAAAIENASRQLFGGGTSISGAIDYARLLLDGSPYKANRRVIDVSGDGVNNSGRPVTEARDEAVSDGIGINGLPILEIDADLDRYYHDNVIGGPGAFVIAAANYNAFAAAILKKLVSEIAAAGRNRAPSFAMVPPAPRAGEGSVASVSQTGPSLRRSYVASTSQISVPSR
jgi:hypothetical protein